MYEVSSKMRKGDIMGISNWKIFELIFAILGALLIAYIRLFPFIEKKEKEPEETIYAMITKKKVKTGTFNTGRSNRGYSYVIYFRTEDGRDLELFAYELEFGRLKEGMQGMLTHKGRYFVRFDQN